MGFLGVCLMTAKPRAPKLTKVVGVTHVVGNVEKLYRISDAIEELKRAGCKPVVPVQLVRTPDNPQDPNAIEVWVRPVGQIGWISRELAGPLSRVLDGIDTPDPEEGQQYVISAEIITISKHPDHPENPGAVIRLHTDVC